VITAAPQNQVRKAKPFKKTRKVQLLNNLEPVVRLQVRLHISADRLRKRF